MGSEVQVWVRRVGGVARCTVVVGARSRGCQKQLVGWVGRYEARLKRWWCFQLSWD